MQEPTTFNEKQRKMIFFSFLFV